MLARTKTTLFLFLTWVLIGMIAGPYIAKTYVIVKFHQNKREIIANSCVQRKSAKNCCQGSCQLNTTLNKIEPTAPAKPIQNPLKSLNVVNSKDESAPKNLSNGIEHPPG
ncbi:MAG: hypothetical protein RIS50_1117 [Bacteroidota bacterium]